MLSMVLYVNNRPIIILIGGGGVMCKGFAFIAPSFWIDYC